MGFSKSKTPVSPSELPNPTPEMGGEFTYPKMVPLVLTHSHPGSLSLSLSLSISPPGHSQERNKQKEGKSNESLDIKTHTLWHWPPEVT